MNISSHDQPHTIVGFRNYVRTNSGLPLLESISPFAELPLLHSILFLWAANHICLPAHTGGTWPKLGPSDLLPYKFRFWMERKKHKEEKEVALSHPMTLPRDCHSSFPERNLSVLPSCDFARVMAKFYLLFVSQSLFLRHESKDKGHSCGSEMEEFISGWSSSKEQCRETVQCTGFWSGLSNKELIYNTTYIYWRTHNKYPHLTDRETEAQGGCITYLKSQLLARG